MPFEFIPGLMPINASTAAWRSRRISSGSESAKNQSVQVVWLATRLFQEILRLITELRPQPPPAPGVRRSTVMRSRERTDRRSASKCQGKWPDQTLDQALGLPEML